MNDSKKVPECRRRRKNVLGKSMNDSKKVPECRRKICGMLSSRGTVVVYGYDIRSSYLGGGLVTANTSEQLTAVNVHNLGNRGYEIKVNT